MRILTLLSRSVAFLMLAACATQHAEFTSQDEATIRRMFDARVADIRADNWVKWSMQHSDSVIVQPAHVPALKGRPSILAWGQSFPAIESLALSDIQIWGEGNLAYATSAYKLKLKDQPVDIGKELLVFRRPQGGAWQVVAFSLSSDLPPAGANPSSK